VVEVPVILLPLKAPFDEMVRRSPTEGSRGTTTPTFPSQHSSIAGEFMLYGESVVDAIASPRHHHLTAHATHAAMC
jgi:hypothetical protein